ncbi:unnamed protein product [Prunus armeniaca]
MGLSATTPRFSPRLVSVSLILVPWPTTSFICIGPSGLLRLSVIKGPGMLQFGLKFLPLLNWAKLSSGPPVLLGSSIVCIEPNNIDRC